MPPSNNNADSKPTDLAEADSFALASFIDPVYDQPEFSGDREKYFILTTPRSGSHFVAHKLYEAGLGVPAEYFNTTHLMVRFAERWQCCNQQDGRMMVNLAPYLDALLRFRTTSNGMFGAKIHFTDIRRVFVASTSRAIFDRAGLILLRRRDLAAQAVSMYRAIKTGRFFGDGQVVAEPSYDFAAINACFNKLREWEAGWHRSLVVRKSLFLELWYEDFLDDIDGQVGRIAEYLGVTALVTPTPAKIRMQPQATVASQDMKAQFLFDLRRSSQ